MDFPGNSHAARKAAYNTPKAPVAANPAEPAEQVEKKPKMAIEGKVIKRREPLSTKLRKVFLDDGESWGERLVEGIVAPMIKDMGWAIVDQITSGIRQGFEDILYSPEDRDRRIRSSSYRRPTIDYGGYSRHTSYRRADDRPPIGRRSNQVKEVVVDSRDKGDWVLAELDAMCDDERYGHCTVGDFYDLVDIEPRSTDHQWGWTDLSKARVERLGPDEFLISMPRPRPIRT